MQIWLTIWSIGRCRTAHERHRPRVVAITDSAAANAVRRRPPSPSVAVLVTGLVRQNRRIQETHPPEPRLGINSRATSAEAVVWSTRIAPAAMAESAPSGPGATRDVLIVAHAHHHQCRPPCGIDGDGGTRAAGAWRPIICFRRRPVVDGDTGARRAQDGLPSGPPMMPRSEKGRFNGILISIVAYL